MSVHPFLFGNARLRSVLAPRKPRHPLMRLALGLLGLGVLAVLVFFSVFVGAAMIAGGLLYRLVRHRGAPEARGDQRIVDAEYRVVRKTADSALPFPR